MNSFNPSNYSSENDIDVSEEVVEKGHKNILKVDIDKFENICRNFREKKDIKIKKLVGQDKEDFDLVVSYVHLLYGTEYYNNLYEKVKKHFKNISTTKPGTIGGYFAGCMSNKNPSIETGCSLGCAGSMPLPKDEEGWSSCDKAVIMGERENGNYVFSVIKPEEDMDSAYVFVESNSLSDFNGFTEYEKENLKAMGCKNVKLIGYSSDMNYSELYEDTKSVNEIKHRHVKKNHKNHKKKNDNWLMVGVIVFFILLIILCLLLGYKYYKY